MQTERPLLGKVCLITGATNGIGLVTARELARQGATVIGVSRNAEKCLTVAKQIRAEADNPNVEFLAADLSAQKSVRGLAEAFLQNYPRLDVLVNNAGALYDTRQESTDKLELTFALNHLSYFLLTHLLLDRLQASAPARIVNVSSEAHRGAQIDFNDLQNRKQYRPFVAYSQSKLANVLFTYELARRLNRTGVTANVLHPGFVATGFGRNNSRGLLRWVMPLIQRFALSPEAGARTSIYLASAPEMAHTTGQYFDEQHRAVASSPASQDLGAQLRLWLVSEQLTGLTTF